MKIGDGYRISAMCYHFDMTEETKETRGRPRKYRDENETNRVMKQRRAERMKAAGWRRSAWWVDDQAAEIVRREQRAGESQDQTVVRLIKMAVGEYDGTDTYPSAMMAKSHTQDSPDE